MRSYWLVPKRSPYMLHNYLHTIYKFDGKLWNDNTKNELSNELLLRKITNKRLSKHGIETIFALCKFLGLVYTQPSQRGIIIFSPAGRKVLDNYDKENEIVRDQLLKWQFPNPSQKIIKGLKIHPFRAFIKILRKVAYVTHNEMALFVMRLRDETEIDLTSKKIQKYRKIGEEKKSMLTYSNTFYKKLHRLSSYARSFFVNTNLVIVNENGNLRLNEEKTALIDKILAEKAIIINFMTEDDWFKYYGDLNVEPSPITAIKYYYEQGRYKDALNVINDVPKNEQSIEMKRYARLCKWES